MQQPGYTHADGNGMTDLFERLLLLKQSPVFSMVSTDDLRYVAQVVDEKEFATGDRIFEINQQGDHMYIVVSGKVGVSISEDPTDKHFIATFTAGDCFGEMNLLDSLPRSASAHVIEDTTVLALEKSRLMQLLQAYPGIGIGMLRSLSMRLREHHGQ